MTGTMRAWFSHPGSPGVLRRTLAALALVTLSNAAQGQKAERPTTSVGDWWHFAEYRTVASSEPNRRWMVTSTTGSRIEGTENGEPLLLTPDLNVLDSPRQRQSNPRLLDFPLERGKRWRYASEWWFKTTGSRGTSDVTVEVVGYEKVGVPAGEFDAFKLQSRARLRGASPKGSVIDADVVSTYWYAPAARAIVKSVSHNPYLGITTVELVDHLKR